MTDRETQLAIERNRLAEYEADLALFEQTTRQPPTFFMDGVNECRERIRKLELEIANEAKQGRLF